MNVKPAYLKAGLRRRSHHAQVELPRVSPLYKGRKYRYAYAGTAKLPTTVVNALSKLDVEAGMSKTWFEQGALPTGEPPSRVFHGSSS